jgi:hypothetical protein
MQRHHRIVSVFAAMLAWHSPAGAAPIEPDDEIVEAGREAPAPVTPAAMTWLLVEARDHARGTSGLAAVVVGMAEEREHRRPASLRVDCFDDLTTVHVDTVGLSRGTSAVAVKHSLDGGRYVPAPWQAGVDGSGLELSADRAIAFVTDLYGKTELRLAIVRPLSVPFLLTFAVGGAERDLHTMAERCHWSSGPSISDAGP